MPERPSLDNGYLWVCNTAMSASQARRIELELGSIRSVLRIRDLNDARDQHGRGFPDHAGSIVELWVHPDDDQHAQDVVTRALSGS